MKPSTRSGRLESTYTIRGETRTSSKPRLDHQRVDLPADQRVATGCAAAASTWHWTALLRRDAVGMEVKFDP